MKNILIGGIKHSGKTSLGRLLAKELGYRFFDLDDLILEQAGSQWKSLRRLYRVLGLAEFRYLEHDATRYFAELILPSMGDEGVVLALGGGSIENRSALAWIKEKGLRVYLHADPELLFSRIMAQGCPPFLSQDNPHDDFLKLYTTRDQLYRQFAQLVHEVDDAPQDINAQRLLVALEKYHVR